MVTVSVIGHRALDTFYPDRDRLECTCHDADSRPSGGSRRPRAGVGLYALGRSRRLSIPPLVVRVDYQLSHPSNPATTLPYSRTTSRMRCRRRRRHGNLSSLQCRADGPSHGRLRHVRGPLLYRDGTVGLCTGVGVRKGPTFPTDDTKLPRGPSLLCDACWSWKTTTRNTTLCRTDDDNV